MALSAARQSRRAVPAARRAAGRLSAGVLAVGHALALAAALVVTLGGCAGLAPERKLAPGQSEAMVLATMGAPTGRYTLPEGAGQRLEYARGPLGFETWMVDLDSSGRVRAVEQVLGPRRFAEVRRGMSEADLLRHLGRPAQRQREYMDRESLYWRFEPYDCLWFGVTLSAQRQVLDAGTLPDPRCDVSQ